MRIIKVNLTDHTIREEAFHQEDYGFFGGRGLIARFLTDYCDPLCDALGPDNPLIFATGYFSGTILTTSNRLSIGAKSPLTGGIKESNCLKGSPQTGFISTSIKRGTPAW